MEEFWFDWLVNAGHGAKVGGIKVVVYLALLEIQSCCGTGPAEKDGEWLGKLI